MGKKKKKNPLPEKYIALLDIYFNLIFRFYKSQRSNAYSVFNVLQLEQAVTSLTYWGGRFENQLVHLKFQSISWYSSNHFSKIME